MTDRHGPARMPATIGFLVVAGGVVAANAHFSQPLVPAIAAEFGVTPTTMGALPAVTQLGVAVGLFTVLPLYDVVERRRLLICVLVALAAAAALHAFATTLPLLFASAFLLGVCVSAAQLMTPYAATMAPAGRAGEASSLVLSGVLLGVLLSRTVAGFVEDQIGWRYIYAISAGCVAMAALVLARMAPVDRAAVPRSYRAVWRSIGWMLRSLPRLRRHALNGALTFGALMAFWGTYAVHVRTAMGLSATATGLIGLVGVAGAAGASFAGRAVDGGRFRMVQLVAAVALLAGYLLLLAGARQIIVFCAGVLLIDMAGGLSHASNQASAFAIDPTGRGQINSVYMVAYFLGGSASVAIGSLLLSWGGWPAVCGYGLALAAIMGAMELLRPAGGLPAPALAPAR